jgi:hypothetical protein
MRIRSWDRNGTGVAGLGCGGFLDSWRPLRSRGREFTLQFPNGALQLCVLFRVLFGEFV